MNFKEVIEVMKNIKIGDVVSVVLKNGNSFVFPVDAIKCGDTRIYINDLSLTSIEYINAVDISSIKIIKKVLIRA